MKEILEDLLKYGFNLYNFNDDALAREDGLHIKILAEEGLKQLDNT